MNIKIGKYRLSSDSMNFIISEIKVFGEDSKKTGEEYDSEYTYYASLEQAFNGLFDKRLRESDANTLEELVNDVKAVRNELKEIFKKVS